MFFKKKNSHTRKIMKAFYLDKKERLCAGDVGDFNSKCMRGWDWGEKERDFS